MSSTVPATRSLTNTPPTSPCLSSIIRRESTSKSCKSSTTLTPTSCSFMKPPTYPTDSGLSLTNSNQSTSASSFSSFNSSTSAAFAINEDTDSQSINTFNSFTTLGKLKNMITRKRSKSLSSMFSSSFSSNNSTRDSSIVSIDITTAASNHHEPTETNNKPNLFKIEETQSLSQTSKYKQSSINQRDKVAAAAEEKEEEEEEEMFENIANDILTKINMEHDYNEDYDVCYSHTPTVRKMSTSGINGSNETSGGIEWKI
ncbi:hypothetical protein WICPIJ_002205 [Wickerhamomyces pijperi]|uniref:Uncharacterized protein n=1 Tax=Wickerhamomyces pijperi TaxID=599730 RepID=A0A9P8TP61_WICPI|nr:hypothetical protein WICPIJ_002205 [Wickerhamomyces pijperi]